ncbi:MULTISPECIES: type II secretion system protein N [Pseudomonas]|uniref:type II secretion system protein N n=1 Tax=Pseudomonas TaxID=286 RepID=UPI001239FE9D|nr:MULTISPECIES: type II secretion system protein N [Pseudomonas]QIB51567.1 type II secretion system protein GspN [Pseudomonas sp. OIL-1]
MLKWLTLKNTLIAAVVIYLLSLLWNLPAAFVWNRISNQLPAEVTLHGLSGTLWSGHVQRMEVSGIDQGALYWDWKPGHMLTGRIALDLIWQPRNGHVDATMKLGFGSVRLEQVNGRLDAASMAAINKAPFVLRGTWLLDVPVLELKDFENVGRAEGQLVWQNAAGGLPRPMELGDLTAALSGEDDWLVFNLGDQGGPLGLRGDARWRPGQAMQIDSRLQARASAEDALAGGLGMLGKPDAQGWIGWRAQLQ